MIPLKEAECISIQPFQALRSDRKLGLYVWGSLSCKPKFSCMRFPPGVLCHSTHYVHEPPGPCCSEASPQHDAVTTMLLWAGGGVFLLMCHAWLLLNIALSMIVKKPQFWTNRTFIHFESPMCLLANTSQHVMFFSLMLAFCLPVCH